MKLPNIKSKKFKPEHVLLAARLSSASYGENRNEIIDEIGVIGERSLKIDPKLVESEKIEGVFSTVSISKLYDCMIQLNTTIK